MVQLHAALSKHHLKAVPVHVMQGYGGVEVSDQLDAPAALHPLPIGQKAG